ncbi:transglycosylase domain-containing protein [Parasulfitobacter algicola]|uniref:peptidoglycan glycosyltransferase n=1 Tax=Parasulfitobacter algicola TaxID=2614809 RepID=A0ABX2IVN2_9RHOB|nr:PBP1A family penicillin-binding protein [Sulfitobacter algicola]NSX54429.1 PBP1A family penicillin-binding protein [Sulfitobacter algicola]
MSTNRTKRPALVADKRYSASKPAAKPRKRKARPKKVAPKGPLGWLKHIALFVLRLIWKLFWRSAVVVMLIVAIAVGYYTTTLPDASDLVDGRVRGSVTLLDREDKIFAWRGDQFGGMITANSVSEHLKHAVIATEDKRFYWHPGVDPRGIASAIKINIREGRKPWQGHGGSTLTQQTAKLLCLGVPFDPSSGMTEAEYEADCRRGTLSRKAQEAAYAMAMEVKYTKDEILTIYLNRAFLGAGARGFEAASQRYFGKSAAEVTPAESAMLAGLLVAPTRFAPTNNLDRSQNRAAVVISLMEDQGYLSASAANTARNNPAILSQAAQARAGGYFADWVMQSGPEFFTRDTTEDVIISTTLDQNMQRAAEEAMAYIFENKVKEGSEAQAAIIVMSADGAVRAMVGGRKSNVPGGWNRATQAMRQTGSAFKPFVYATAMELGYGPYDRVEDTPLVMDIPGSDPWKPENYDRQFRGVVTLTHALKDSLNIPAIRVSEAVGRENVAKVSSDFGIKSSLAEGPAIALGTSEATLIEMTGAYAGILNGGSSVTPYGLVQLRLKGDNEPLMDNAEGGIGERVISERAAADLIFMMNQVVENGTGRRAALDGRQVAGKTGTTTALRDAWFIGFSADYVAGVWMGYDDNTPLRGVTGGGLPAEIWHETMKRVHAGLPANPLPMSNPEPPRVVQTQQPSRRNNRNNNTERVLLDVLNEILGGGRN